MGVDLSPGGQTAYMLAVLTAPGRNQSLPGSATSAADPTGGAISGYVLVAHSGATAIGNTDVVCGLPGFSSNLVAAGRP